MRARKGAFVLDAVQVAQQLRGGVSSGDDGDDDGDDDGTSGDHEGKGRSVVVTRRTFVCSAAAAAAAAARPCVCIDQCACLYI